MNFHFSFFLSIFTRFTMNMTYFLRFLCIFQWIKLIFLEFLIFFPFETPKNIFFPSFALQFSADNEKKRDADNENLKAHVVSQRRYLAPTSTITLPFRGPLSIFFFFSTNFFVFFSLFWPKICTFLNAEKFCDFDFTGISLTLSENLNFSAWKTLGLVPEIDKTCFVRSLWFYLFFRFPILSQFAFFSFFLVSFDLFSRFTGWPITGELKTSLLTLLQLWKLQR